MPTVSKGMSGQKATGMDGIKAQFFKYNRVMTPVWGVIDQMINGNLNLFKLPSFKQSRMVKFKKKECREMKDVRPIQILSNFRKATEKVINNVGRIFDYQLPGTQQGGKIGGSVFIPIVMVLRHVMQEKPVVFLDISKAYDKLDRTMVKVITRARGLAYDLAFDRENMTTPLQFIN